MFVGWPVCLRFTSFITLFVWGLWEWLCFFLGAVPPNFRHGGGPGAARAYDIHIIRHRALGTSGVFLMC